MRRHPASTHGHPHTQAESHVWAGEALKEPPQNQLGGKEAVCGQDNPKFQSQTPGTGTLPNYSGHSLVQSPSGLHSGAAWPTHPCSGSSYAFHSAVCWWISSPPSEGPLGPSSARVPYSLARLGLAWLAFLAWFRFVSIHDFRTNSKRSPRA